MDLTPDQVNTVSTVYISALAPLLFMLILCVSGRAPKWVLSVWLKAFFACAIGWEIWLTFGLVDGLDVNSRRPEALTNAIPIHINWLLNSLADASICLFGALLVWLAYGRKTEPFQRWHWGAFFIFASWFVGQNLWVELYIYQTQLAEGLRLSWAPLIPTGPWLNPVLFELQGRTVQLQTQLPWILMTPLFYWILIRQHRQSEAR
ncbi:MAG: hypothetical protein AB8C02_05070 [Halioglobus sp.]